MKKILILTASPHKDGNTNALVRVFCDELHAEGVRYETVDLYDEDIRPCLGCRKCQVSMDRPGCILGDDELFDKILGAELIVLASPVYSWYCTAPAKALLDRCVYALNKYYGGPGEASPEKRGPSLWEGKMMALITTCGYPPDMGTDILEDGIRRYCRHSKLRYAGMLAEQHKGYGVIFMDKDKEKRARDFAQELTGKVK